MKPISKQYAKCVEIDGDRVITDNGETAIELRLLGADIDVTIKVPSEDEDGQHFMRDFVVTVERVDAL